MGGILYGNYNLKSQSKEEAQRRENDELIIEENTIYEIDLDCYECMQQERIKEKSQR